MSEDELPKAPVESWEKMLHCGILIAAGNPNFSVIQAENTFAGLEDLFLGVLWSGSGRIVQFSEGVLSNLQSELSDNRLRRLEREEFGSEPPKYGKPKDSEEKNKQEMIYDWWMEWQWLRRYPCRKELLEALEEILSEEYGCEQAERFVHEIGRGDLLRQAISLYLYQAGVSGMADKCYYIAYAMLCRTQEQLLAAMTEGEDSP